MAGRARNEVELVELLRHTRNRLLLLICQRLEILHVGNVILHLVQRAHAGQHHADAVKARRIADRIAGVGIVRAMLPVQAVEDLLCMLRQIDQTAALHRLHDEERLIVLSRHLVNLAALYGSVLVIQVVELNLDNLNLRIIRENLIKHVHLVVK